MLRILILTYYFPPSNATAANRPLSWANNLKDNGIETVVVTRHWLPSDDNAASLRAPSYRPAEKVVNEKYTLFRVPYRYGIMRKIGEQWLSGNGFLRKLYYFVLACLGYFNIDMDLSRDIRIFLKAHLKTNRYDVLLVTTPPFSLIRLASEVSLKYQIPYVVDFRDLWNANKELKWGYADKGMKGILNRVTKNHISRWLSNASLTLVATPPMADHIKRIGYHGPVKVLLNGFEADLRKKYSEFTPRKEIFTIACVGTLYAEQDLLVFTEGFLSFIQNNLKADAQLRLIGIGFNRDVEAWFSARIPSPYLVTTERVPRDMAMRETFGAHVLYFPAWRGYRGIFTSKIFEYLASGRNILVAPGDDGSIDSLIKETGTGKVASSSAEVCDILSSWYSEWVSSGKLKYLGDQRLVEAYSRERQAALLATYLKEVLIQ